MANKVYINEETVLPAWYVAAAGADLLLLKQSLGGNLQELRGGLL
jgi:hypothetical protein